MKKKILASVLAVVTMAMCAFSAVACNQDVPQEDEVSSSVQEEVKDSGNLAVEDVTTTPGMRLNVKRLSTNYTGGDPDAGIATVAEDAYQLTATVLPADAADKTVTYSVAWSNANSAWAKGKTVTDYVSVAQTSTGSVTATATCKQAFGEPIVVTVTSNNNTAAKATATLHYKQKVASYWIMDGTGEDHFEACMDYTEYGSGTDFLEGHLFVNFEAPYEFTRDNNIYGAIQKTTVYTRANDVTVSSLVLTPTEEFKQVLSSLGISTTVESNGATVNYSELPSIEWYEEYGTTNAKKNQIIDALVAFGTKTAYTAVVTDSDGGSATFTIILHPSDLANQKVVETVSLNNVEVEF